VADATVSSELDLGVTLADARKSVGLVTRDSVALASHSLDGDGIAAKAGDEAIAFFGLARTAGGERETGDNDVSHATTFDHGANARKTRSDEVMRQTVRLRRSVDGIRLVRCCPLGEASLIRAPIA
jgi:hypothetical protein